MELTYEQEQIVELLRGLASAGAVDSEPSQTTGTFYFFSNEEHMPWRNKGVRVTDDRDFGVGMPPLTQCYS